MGRDKPKKYSKMGYFEKQRYYEDQGKKYNIDRDSFENSQGGGGRYEDFDDDAFREAVQNAQRNDFDYRTSAQHMDGIKGDASSADFINYQRGAHKLHRKAGNGGEYSSNEDITTVTNNLVNDYRKTTASKSPINKAKDDVIQQEKEEEYTPSKEMTDAHNTVEEFDNTDFNVYNDAQSSDGNEQREQAAGSFLDKYKMNLKSKMKPKLPS